LKNAAVKYDVKEEGAGDSVRGDKQERELVEKARVDFFDWFTLAQPLGLMTGYEST
jgi:hypothetical protein